MKNYDVWQYLNTPSKDKIKKIDKLDEYAPLPNGIVTDGEGNLYEIPTEGKTPLRSVDLEYMKFSYNWKTKLIEVYLKNDDDTFELYDEFSLNPSSFIDNPKYWYMMLEHEYEDEIYSQINEFTEQENVAENINSYKYNYQLYADVKLKVKNGDKENKTKYIKD